MKTVTMHPDAFRPEFIETPDKRNDFESDPNPIGFYHYPNTIQDKTAFGRLKKEMIKNREDRIKLLQKEINKLRKVKYEED